MQSNYRVNEIAVNWNSALIYAFAGFLTSKVEAPIAASLYVPPPVFVPHGCSCRISSAFVRTSLPA